MKTAQKRDLVTFLQTALRMRFRDLAAARVRHGYRRLHVLLRRDGRQVNHKRAYRRGLGDE